jgi:hypothetical protein
MMPSRRSLKGPNSTEGNINQATQRYEYEAYIKDRAGRNIVKPTMLTQDDEASSMKAEQFQITSIDPDSLTGIVVSGTSTNVAKPYLLRRSLVSRDGITYTYSANQAREANDGADTEEQVVVPSYIVGDYIYGARARSTGVIVSGVECSFIDINADGRAWAKQA